MVENQPMRQDDNFYLSQGMMCLDPALQAAPVVSTWEYEEEHSPAAAASAGHWEA